MPVPALQNFAGSHERVTATLPVAAPSGADYGRPSPISSESIRRARRAADAFRDVLVHVEAIEQLLNTGVLDPRTLDEEAEFEQLLNEIIQRLDSAARSLGPGD
ncbi:hypothetical protein ABIA32_006538 [Streptacidiphilus sp. MAP12-20]